MAKEIEILSAIALQQIKGLGISGIKKLISYFGSAENVFLQNKKELNKITGINKKAIKSILNKEGFKLAEKELKYIEKNDIKIYYFLDKNFPIKLKNCSDSPVLLFVKGNFSFERKRYISIVGTRNCSEYGKRICEKLVEDLIDYDPVIISGLAYGIDICAHKASLKNNIPTLAVLAHGLNYLYPSQHKNTAEKIIKNGALITEYLSFVKVERQFFPQRNRIVAGLSDAVVVIESKKRGGALITAEIANSYNRDVFAFPGKTFDENSEGCNWLIKTNRASLITSAEDIAYIMNWPKRNIIESKQKSIAIAYTDEEEKIINELEKKNMVPIDELSYAVQLPVSKVSALLLELEFKGVVKSLPGKIYQILS